MNDCPDCEYHKQRAARWRAEAYKQAGHDVIELPWVGLTDKEREEATGWSVEHIEAKLKQKNIGILITDHNVQETLSITDRAYLLFEGKLLKHGTAEELANDEMVRKVYLGQNFELRRSKSATEPTG